MIALDIPIDSEEENYYVYFLVDSAETILYIGKTTRLRARMRQHFVAELVAIETWRESVNRNKIITVKCNNACDMDLYETYFINKYKPLYNKDKIFNSSPTFEFPVIEPVIYKFKLKVIVGEGSFKENSIRYIENEEDRDILGLKYPLIKKAFEELGSDKMRALSYNSHRYLVELSFKSENINSIIKEKLLQELLLNVEYKASYIKDLFNNLYRNL